MSDYAAGSLGALLAFQVQAWRSQPREELDKPEYRAYLQSEGWKIKSSMAKERAGFMCAICQTHENLNTHHRTYERLGNEFPDDLIVLCRDCHTKHHEDLKPIEIPF